MDKNDFDRFHAIDLSKVPYLFQGMYGDLDVPKYDSALYTAIRHAF